jgi:Glyoxalase/Bleomycin resistance protein/Dioxygenase superfamily
MSAEYVNHISYEVNDYKKVRDFYVDLLGMKVTEDDGKQCRLVFGNNMLIPRNRAGGGPCGILRLNRLIGLNGETNSLKRKKSSPTIVADGT